MENYSNEWTCTDASTDQYGRQLSERVFEFKQAEIDYKNEGTTLIPVPTGDYISAVVDLNRYSEDSMYDRVCAYYGWNDFQEFLTSPDGLWIIAECIFESENI